MLGGEEIEAAAGGFLERDVLARHLLPGRSVARVEAKGALWVAVLEPSGHIVLAGSDRAEPIVGFSPEDYAEPEEGSPAAALYAAKSASVGKLEADGLAGVQEGWADLLGEGRHHGTRSGPVVPAADAVYVEPFMASRWDQCQPYNDYAPVWNVSDREGEYRGRDACGCVATTTAQLLRHFRWPARIGGSRTVEHMWYDGLGNGRFTVRFDGRAPLDWDVFGDEYPWYGNNRRGYDLRGTLPEAERYPIARLMLWADSLGEMAFESRASSASYEKVAENLSDWYTEGTWLEANSADLSALAAHVAFCNAWLLRDNLRNKASHSLIPLLGLAFGAAACLAAPAGSVWRWVAVGITLADTGTWITVWTIVALLGQFAASVAGSRRRRQR